MIRQSFAWWSFTMGRDVEPAALLRAAAKAGARGVEMLPEPLWPIARDAGRWKALVAKSPDVAMQTTYFQANIGKVKTADDLIGNARLFTYAMSAFGLGDRAYAKGLMKRVLQQSVSSPTALAYKLNDPNILAFAKAFDFAKNGAQTTQSASLVQSTVDQYTQNALEKGQAQQNPGVGLALYFQRKAPAITSAASTGSER